MHAPSTHSKSSPGQGSSSLQESKHEVIAESLADSRRILVVQALPALVALGLVLASS